MTNPTFRARVITAAPTAPAYMLVWRVGGEGLGGTSRSGALIASPGAPLGTFSDPAASAGVFDSNPTFGTFVVEIPGKTPQPVNTCVVEFEFTYADGTVSTFQQTSPLGATVGLAYSGGKFIGLTDYVAQRRAMVDAADPVSTPPQQLAFAGHLMGFGGPPKGQAGYGIRHNDPGILDNEVEVMRRLGFNGQAQDQTGFVASGEASEFSLFYLGPPGAGAPTTMIQNQLHIPSTGPIPCPFDPKSVTALQTYIKSVLPVLAASGCTQTWSQIGDELHLQGQTHIVGCPFCAVEFPNYVAANNGPATAAIYPVWSTSSTGTMAPRPSAQADRLNYYWTVRYAQHVTAAYFAIAKSVLTPAGFPLYTMQQPNPTWGPQSFDWFEFYRSGAIDAAVWETSNTEARLWHWDSYVADIVKVFGLLRCVLSKPDRGGYAQRVLAQVARGVENFNPYVYGPDYAKGDSFSGIPNQLLAVVNMANFLGLAESLFVGASQIPSDVALLYPRSAETWDLVANDGLHIEDTRWMYTALRHAQIPVDVIGEDADFTKYKVIYVVGANIRTDVSVRLMSWVQAGGYLWVGPGGLYSDESDSYSAYQPSMERWCPVPLAIAGGLNPIVDPLASTRPTVVFQNQLTGAYSTILPVVGRELLAEPGTNVVASFSDGASAFSRMPVGLGMIYRCGIYAGLTYSAVVRRGNFDTRSDYSQVVRSLISSAALDRQVAQPVSVSDPVTEAVALQRTNGLTIALMNWNYQPKPTTSPWLASPVQNLIVSIPGAPQSVTSVRLGDLPITRSGLHSTVTLPMLNDVDALDVR